jgi:hypothetical protein
MVALVLGLTLPLTLPWGQLSDASAAQGEREPVILKVVVVNPSLDKTKTIPVRIDLPAEVAPEHVLDKGDLSIDYDSERGIYYVYKEAVELAPKETRVFQVVVRDLWFIPEGTLESIRSYTQILLGRLKGTEYFQAAQELGNSILLRLEQIEAQQNDETLSRKTRIGNYRRHTQIIKEIKEDLLRMEKLLSFTGGPPVPEMLKESPLKSDAPSQTTTWLVIFLILIFLGLLGGQFFFTWHRRLKTTQELAAIRQATFSILTGGDTPHKADISKGRVGPQPKASGEPPVDRSAQKQHGL